MSKQANDTGDAVSVSAPALSKLCVLLPVILALVAIFSTPLSADTQSQLIMGLPAILWLWFAIALLICLNTLVFALQVIKGKDNVTDDELTDNQLTASKGDGDHE